MNMFFRQSINEYQRQISLEESFELQTERLAAMLESLARKESFAAAENDCRQRRALLLLAPLVETAWADGRVTRRESDAIIKVAERYGLIDEQKDFCALIENLTSRPAPHAVGRMWQQFQRFFENLSEPEREDAKFCIELQARFVAEQSSNDLMSFLRGERISEIERDFLRIVAEQLENAHARAKALETNEIFNTGELIEMNETEILQNDYERAAEANAAAREDYAKLIPLVPLVKTAWAEGRITRRERELILEAAKNMGIEPDSSAYRRLSDWFELHPTDEFYDESLQRLRGEFEKLPEEERALRRLDLLSDCVNVAEASGGTSRFPAGGAKICSEEIAAIKRIAIRLNGAGAV